MFDRDLIRPSGLRPDPERTSTFLAPDALDTPGVSPNGPQASPGPETPLRPHLQQTIVLLKDLADQEPGPYLLLNGIYARYIDSYDNDTNVVRGFKAGRLVAILPLRSDWLIEKVTNVVLVTRSSVLKQRVEDHKDMRTLTKDAEDPSFPDESMVIEANGPRPGQYL